MRRVVGRYRHRRVRAEQLADAAGIHDDVRADVEAPLAQERVEQRRAGPRRVHRWIDQRQHLAAAGDVLVQRVDLRLQEVGLRPGDDEHRGIGRHFPRLRQHQRLDAIVVGRERLRQVAVARAAVRVRRVLLAVSLREVHLARRAGHRLDERVGDGLLVAAGGALGAVLVPMTIVPSDWICAALARRDFSDRRLGRHRDDW
jgi:hypothetical protein